MQRLSQPARAVRTLQMQGRVPLLRPVPLMQLDRFSALLLAWHRLAADAPAGGFHGEALALLEQAVAFDSAWWGTGNLQAGQPGVVQGYLHRLPPEFVNDWWGIAGVDALARRVAEQPGVTVLADGGLPVDDAEDAFDERYGLARALSTGLPDESTGLSTFLSLFRGNASPAFDEAERALVEVLVPHLMLAEQTHWRTAFRRQIHAAAEHGAQVDESGFLTQASPGFCQALVREFPGWPGGLLPEPLRPLLMARQGTWAGRRIEVRLEPGALQLGGGHLSVRPRIGHGLTPREEGIARAYAAGDSYKEIARQLGLSPATVRGYLRDCYLKLGVSNKAALGGVLQGGGVPGR